MSYFMSYVMSHVMSYVMAYVMSYNFSGLLSVPLHRQYHISGVCLRLPAETEQVENRVSDQDALQVSLLDEKLGKVLGQGGRGHQREAQEEDDLS